MRREVFIQVYGFDCRDFCFGGGGMVTEFGIAGAIVWIELVRWDKINMHAHTHTHTYTTCINNIICNEMYAGSVSLWIYVPLYFLYEYG